jgi:hypothetical protein
MSESSREEIALAMFTAMLPRVMDRTNAMAFLEGKRKVANDEIAAAWQFADLWISQRPKGGSDEPQG